MDEKAILHWLTGTPFFTDFTAEGLKNLVSQKKYFLEFTDGQCIVEEGKIDKTLFVLLKGKTRVSKKSKNEDITVTHLNEGAVFGAMFLISKKERPYKFSLISEGETTVIGLTSDFFKSLDSGLQIKLKEQLMELVFTRLDNLVEKHSDLMKDMLF